MNNSDIRSYKMKILYVSRSHSGKPSPFVLEQAESMTRSHPVEIDHYFIKKSGLIGYLGVLVRLPEVIKVNDIDIVHVHNGLSAFAVILSKILLRPSMRVISTFHGSDLNDKSKRRFSLLASRFSSHNIVVSPKMSKFLSQSHSIVPCGVDTNIQFRDRNLLRAEHAWTENHFIILFSSSFERTVKDPEFAFEVVKAFKKTSTRDVKFLELKGYNRDELTWLMQAADALIMCSKMEGSPQVIKEAILNSLPIVSNEVGDVAEICEGADNCFIVDKTVSAFVERLDYIANSNVRVEFRESVIEKFDNNTISKKLYDIYYNVLNRGF